MIRLMRKLFGLVFCRPRTLAELRDCQRDWEGKLAISNVAATTASLVRSELD